MIRRGRPGRSLSTAAAGQWSRYSLDRARIPRDRPCWRWPEVGATPAPFLIVIAEVDVGCHCATDHERHTVQRHEWLAGTGDALADAFEAAVETVRGWLDGPREPTAWRARAGLPNPASTGPAGNG